MIENKSNEITLIYNSEKHDDKKARGYVESLHGYTIKTIDLSQETLTETQIAQLAQKMEGKISELIDPTFDDSKAIVNQQLDQLEGAELVKVLRNNNKLLSTPILIVGDRAYKYGSGYGLIKEEMVHEVGHIKSANREEQRRD